MKGRIQRPNKPQSIKINTLGHVRIGERVVNPKTGKENPSSFDYFKIDGDSEDYNKAVHDVYGDKPNMLRIAFLSDDMSECCNHFLELRDGAGKCVVYGDGVEFHEVREVERKFVYVLVKPKDPEAYMAEMESKVGKQFTESLKMRFLIMGTAEKPIPLFGTWELNTKGIESSIKNIVGQVDTVLEATGRIRMIPFDLHVKKVKSDKAGNSSRYPVLSLFCNLSVDRMENLHALPITGMVTESKIAAITSGSAPQSTVQTQVDEVEYTEVEEITFSAKEYFAGQALETLDEFNSALVAVKADALLTNADKTECFNYLVGLGKFTFNRDTKRFEGC